MDAFRLGDEYPGWWHRLVIENKVITSNDDGRFRGGPDKARITQGNGYLWANKGDYIMRAPDGRISVARYIGEI